MPPPIYLNERLDLGNTGAFGRAACCGTTATRISEADRSMALSRADANRADIAPIATMSRKT